MIGAHGEAMMVSDAAPVALAALVMAPVEARIGVALIAPAAVTSKWLFA